MSSVLADCLQAVTIIFWLCTWLPFAARATLDCRYPGQAERFEQRLQGLTAKFRNLHLAPRITDRSALPWMRDPSDETAHLVPQLSPLLLTWKPDFPQ